MEPKMDNNNTQSLTTNAGAWNAFYDRMCNNSLVTARTKVTAAESTKHYSNNESGFETYHLFSKLIPKIEVVVIDPFSIYSSENEESDSDNDSDSKIDLQQPELHDFQKSGDLTLKSTEVERMGNDIAQCPLTPPSSQESVQIVESSGPFYPAEPVDTVEHIELIDGLFDYVTFNTEEENILLQEMKSFEDNNQNFDLAAYITDQSESPVDSPELASPSENYKTHALHPMVQQPIKEDDSKIMADNSRRKKLKREYVGDGEDDCKKLKKRKIEDDTLWMPAKKPKAPVDNNRKVQPSNKDINVVPKINGIRHRIGRGKDIATLAKYYKRSTFDENSNCDNVENKTVNRNQKSPKEKSPKKKTIENVNKVKEQIHKKIENNSSAQKSQNVINKSKVKEMNNKAADLPDFAKAIMASMEAPKIKPNLSKRNKLTVQSQKIQFQEHSETFRQYLSDKATKTKILKENNHRVPVASIVNSVPKAGNIDSRKLLSKLTPPQGSRKMTAENCAMIEKKEESTTGTSKITIHESLQWKSVPQSATSDQNIDSNVKRKITVEEYFKRKAMVQSA